MISSYFLHLLSTWGYPLLFVWSVLEGEFGLMFSALLAKNDIVFSYKEIVAVAILGAIIGDVSLFFAGRLFRKKIKHILKEYPTVFKKSSKWFKKYGNLVIIFERFIYGTHIPTILVIGLSRYSFAKFILYDVLGVVLWAFSFVSIGYFFGQSAINMVVFIQKHLLVFIILFMIAFIFYFLFDEN